MLEIRSRGFVEVSVLPRESHVYGGGGWVGVEAVVEAALQQLHNQPTRVIQPDTMASQPG